MKTSFINGPILPEYISKSISNHAQKKSIGGHSIFLGQVRSDVIENKEVDRIEFTAYDEMAEIKIAEIREDMFSKYSLVCLHFYHSLGIIEAGKICMFVFVSSKHRKAAISACEEMVERIKKEVPIWGRTIFVDESFKWKENI